jgi:hypothetical protein
MREGKYIKNVCYVLLTELEKSVKGKEDGEVVKVYLSTLEVAELVGVVNETYRYRERVIDVDAPTSEKEGIKFFDEASYNKLSDILNSSFKHLKSRLALLVEDTFLITKVRDPENPTVIQEQREATIKERSRIIEVKKSVLESYGVKTEKFMYSTILAHGYNTKVALALKKELGIAKHRRVKRFSFSNAIALSIRSYREEIDRDAAKLTTNGHVVTDLLEKLNLYIDKREGDTLDTKYGNREEQFKEVRDFVEYLLEDNIKIKIEEKLC